MEVEVYGEKEGEEEKVPAATVTAAAAAVEKEEEAAAAVLRLTRLMRRARCWAPCTRRAR